MRTKRNDRSKASFGEGKDHARERLSARSGELSHPLLRIQRSLGNQGALRFLESSVSQGERGQTKVTSAPAPSSISELKLSRPGDDLEQEAERIAGQAMRAPIAAVASRPCAACSQRPSGHKCAQCRSSERKLARNETGAGPRVAPPIVGQVLRSTGLPLDSSTRNTMEARFGHDLSRVQLHTDARAAESARAVSASAYAVGNHVVFGNGKYRPTTSQGQTLLAHELAHVLQQQQTICRTPDPATLATFDQRAQAIRANPAYVALARADRAVAEDIIREARTRDNCLYYIDKLALLFNTPEEPPVQIASRVSRSMSEAAARERARLATPEGRATVNVEEQPSTNPARVWTTRTGVDNTNFEVDNRDPSNIVVRARVHLVPRGQGTPQDVANLRAYEGAIEKEAAVPGYTVDLQFVDAGGPGIFTVGVDTGSWPTSGNWVRGPHSLAHELHHLLGLDDRYHYIEAQAGNRQMMIPKRLHWFRVQMGKPPDPEGQRSLMGRGPRLLDDDVCRVAGLNLDSCVRARSLARPAPPGRTAVELSGGAALNQSVGSSPPPVGTTGAISLGLRYSLRPDRMIVVNPIVGARLLYLPSAEAGGAHLVAALAEAGLRFQNVRGLYFDTRIGVYAGINIPGSGARPPFSTVSAQAGGTAALGLGYRWGEHVEVGAEVRDLVGSMGTNHVVILGGGAWHF